ncbi:hypothetical protein SERLA73DRAFT_183676 [Serpula lacrymans var. lacrymans S7.3]|uniref:Uncharacterized protein n=2 Tax=Serpula lacrymans var. lacrymans TaxID=341189 RepID=F8Q0E4_SERL3|nr:uncharacterized protein SERLADRAFT_470985 [Serpula lacrymans var. lacrymans S7.9]EGN98594.1 hypothetical protein SERLA73DRAFT_183676 [Serpula lacrymans var. lacrymans S7.3]EGO24159.1 hypothetical protein SERLADRAFT_470985 [Serpula lacrymans var. lacrymans S7.9]
MVNGAVPERMLNVITHYTTKRQIRRLKVNMEMDGTPRGKYYLQHDATTQLRTFKLLA